MSKETLVTKESSEMLKKYATIRKAADSKWVDDTKNVRNVGNNGYVIGQQFELDGTFGVEEIKNGNKVTGGYFACGTKQGILSNTHSPTLPVDISSNIICNTCSAVCSCGLTSIILSVSTPNS